MHREVAGLGLLKLLLKSIGVHGVTGMDTMLAFRCSRDLGYVIKVYTQQVCACTATLTSQPAWVRDGWDVGDRARACVGVRLEWWGVA